MGWVNFNTNAPANFSGDLNWFKNTKLSDKIYRAGFSNAVTITGSPYAPPAAGTRALNWTNGTVILTGGNLPAPSPTRSPSARTMSSPSPPAPISSSSPSP